MLILPSENIVYHVGGPQLLVSPLEPFCDEVCSFLNDLSLLLNRSPDLKSYPDVATFSFWCRSAHIEKLKKNWTSGQRRMGRGVVLHIAPANVPVNFAFSFVFGLLAGNANIVRLPSQNFPQTAVLSSAIREVFENLQYSRLREMNVFLNYAASDEMTEAFSKIVQARVIWGGDETIRQIRKLHMNERCVEVVFADRFSFSLIESQEILRLDNNGLRDLAVRFFNDNYLMDQNACSSAHLVVWLGSNVERAQKIFWSALSEVVREKYKLLEVQVVDKYSQLCRDAIESPEARSSDWSDLGIFRVQLDKIPELMTEKRGRFGYFYEYAASDLRELLPVLGQKTQTITYFGLDKEQIFSFLKSQHVLGIDRVVPVGQALDMDMIWDGYDVVHSLSRIIDVR